MLETLINKFNILRKKEYFRNEMFQVQKKYACIGIGMHSLTNIFPVLKHYNIPVKVICTKKTNWSREAALIFPNAVFTCNLEDILNDKEIIGVFVSTNPSEHFGILQLLLQAGKQVFIEKPPCNSGTELDVLIATNPSAVCKIGFQRRHWPANEILLKKIGKASSYIYKFYFGPYPNGNVFNELFIHALDYCQFLFGDGAIINSTRQKNQQGVTIQIQLKHEGGTIGYLELSSQFSWKDPIDEISIHTPDELIIAKYPLQVTGIKKPKRLLNLPTERIFNQPSSAYSYFSTGNLVMPVQSNNTLYLQGFYSELANFIRLVETGNRKSQLNDLPGMMSLYKIIDQLNSTT